jgi:choline kinase
MEAVIIAAGRGSRLGAVGLRTPKCLLKVNGLSLLAHQFRSLRQAGVAKVTVVAGHLAEKVAAFIGSNSYGPEVRLLKNPEYVRNGGAASFFYGTQSTDDDILYLIGDMIYQAELLHHLIRPYSDITLGIQIRKTTREDMKVAIDGSAVTAVGKDLKLKEAAGEFLGMAYIPQRWLRTVRAVIAETLVDPAKSRYHFGDIIRECILGGIPVGWVDLSAYRWHEIDSVSELTFTRSTMEVEDGSL